MKQLSLFSTPAPPPSVGVNIVPRDYQQRAITKSFDFFARGSRGVLIRQPTGSGKTVCGTLIADRWCQQGPDYRAIVVSHERQLIQQFAREIEDILHMRPGIEMGADRLYRQTMPTVVVASRQSLNSKDRLKKFDRRLKWLVVVDEVHRWAYKLSTCRPILEWFEQNPDARRIGLTATPERTDKTTLSRVVPDVAADYRLYDLDGGPSAVGDGWAVPYDQRFITVEGLDFRNLRQVAGDFTDEELAAVLAERRELMQLIQPMLDLVDDRPTLIFNPTRAMAAKVALTINAELDRGLAAVSIDGTVPDRMRQEIYARFERGDFQFLSVCGLCREGYNNPSIGAIAVFRPTKSRVLAEQMKGRGCRPLRGLVDGLPTPEMRRKAIAASSKPSCMIIDLVGVTGLADCATTAHLLGQGRPDEVIERANENARKKDGPVDMAEELRTAQHQIDKEEKERLRQERIERKRRAEEEARRRSRIGVDVHYRQHQVTQGKGGRTTGRRKGARFIWGKYKGILVSDVPDWYLNCKAIANFPPWLQGAVKKELRLRQNPAREPVPAGLSIDEVNRILL